MLSAGRLHKGKIQIPIPSRSSSLTVCGPERDGTLGGHTLDAFSSAAHSHSRTTGRATMQRQKGKNPKRKSPRLVRIRTEMKCEKNFFASCCYFVVVADSPFSVCERRGEGVKKRKRNESTEKNENNCCIMWGWNYFFCTFLLFF